MALAVKLHDMIGGHLKDPQVLQKIPSEQLMKSLKVMPMGVSKHHVHDTLSAQEFSGVPQKGWMEFWSTYFEKVGVLQTVSEELAARFAQDARIDASFDFRGASQADAEILDRKYMMILMYSCKQ